MYVSPPNFSSSASISSAIVGNNKIISLFCSFVLIVCLCFKNMYVSPPNFSSSASISSAIVGNNKTIMVNKTEKSLKKVMDLSCLGPNTVRF
ncbi:hypothetical protein ACJIZ3_003497 [Penstemon smallii]|uniref:Uncharacterized protein n=1 Tax=Penstemon smallii TaxID=265156 RepID=A0ABD3U9F9_9LAMI